MSSTYTPSNTFDTAEKDWQHNLGMLDWDNTNIVFTKRTLIEFLKYTGTTVDTNMSNISKLPRYAKFGKLTAGAPASSASTEAIASPSAAETDDFTPSRRVRAPPGGKHTDIFSFDAGDDALSTAPPKPTEEVATPEQPADPVAAAAAAPAQSEFEPLTDMKPTRRVRDNPGGKDSIGSLWDEAKPGEFDFKPTRRVRQGPGGQDSISGIF